MSIDEAIAKIWHCIVSIRECVGNKDFVKALETAIDTMRKYQKIEEIMQRKDLYADDACMLVMEVIRNGAENEKRK